MSKEIVTVHEQHTLMWTEITLRVDEAILAIMLKGEITEDSKRELLQTYYLCKLQQSEIIQPREYYGAWNVSIEEISHLYSLESMIVSKLSPSITTDDIDRQVRVINRLTHLSEDEECAALPIKYSMYSTFGIV